MSKEQFIIEREQKIESAIEAGLTEEEAERMVDEDASLLDKAIGYDPKLLNNLQKEK